MVLSSCSTKDEPAVTTANDVVISQSPTDIPRDHPFLHRRFDWSTGWLDYDRFYRIEVIPEREQAYFPTLQWVVLTDMIENSRFLYEAPEEIRRFYIDEMDQRPFIPNPEVAYRLIETLWDNRHPIDPVLFNFCQSIYTRNYEYLGEDEFSEHFAIHEDTYDALDRLADGLGLEE